MREKKGDVRNIGLLLNLKYLGKLNSSAAPQLKKQKITQEYMMKNSTKKIIAKTFSTKKGAVVATKSGHGHGHGHHGGGYGGCNRCGW